jgi:hypothetical protein
MDSLMHGDRRAAVSKLAVLAIAESLARTGVAYEPYVDGFINQCCIREGKNGDARGIVSNACRHLESTHYFVRGRLENPKSDIEIDVAHNGNRLEFWLKDPRTVYANHAVMERAADKLLQDKFLGSAGPRRPVGFKVD